MLDNSFVEVLTIKEIIIRIMMSIFLGGMIGYERGRHNNRPAGFRTHILVCLGAAIISLIQDQLRVNIFNYAVLHESVTQVLKTDLGRMGAQVVSGIGFLGAGTIMRDKGMVGGLTTAASLWVTGCLGLGIGWGFYNLAIPCGISIIVVLVVLKQLERTFIEKKCIYTIEIKLIDENNFSSRIIEVYKILKDKSIQMKTVEKDIQENKLKYKFVLSKQINIMDIENEIINLNYVKKVNLI